eukprot:SAG31_NODE_37_length_31616_cov_38.688359_19_plen_272_part_00
MLRLEASRMAREPMYYVLWAISWVVIVIVSFVAVIIGVAQLVRLSLLPSYVMSYPVLTISEMQVPWEPDHTVSEYFKLADDDDPSADLRDELGRLKLSALKRRARFEGVDAARLEAAEDADNPKHTIIELIVLASPVADGVEREPSCKSTAGKTCGATHHTPEWFEKRCEISSPCLLLTVVCTPSSLMNPIVGEFACRSKAVVDDVASVVGRSLSKLVMKYGATVNYFAYPRMRQSALMALWCGQTALRWSDLRCWIQVHGVGPAHHVPEH